MVVCCDSGGDLVVVVGGGGCSSSRFVWVVYVNIIISEIHVYIYIY